MSYIDLHMHSNYSDDGEFTPKELADLCIERGVKYFAIADHNSVRGIEEGKEYIKDKKDYEYMFKSRKGVNKPIGIQAVTNAIKEAANYFGLYDITAHSMRKTYAYKIYIESDRDIVVVKELLGHSSIEETKRYIGLDREKYHQYSKSLRDFVRWYFIF